MLKELPRSPELLEKLFIVNADDEDYTAHLVANTLSQLKPNHYTVHTATNAIDLLDTARLGDRLMPADVVFLDDSYSYNR